MSDSTTTNQTDRDQQTSSDKNTPPSENEINEEVCEEKSVPKSRCKRNVISVPLPDDCCRDLEGNVIQAFD